RRSKRVCYVSEQTLFSCLHINGLLTTLSCQRTLLYKRNIVIIILFIHMLSTFSLLIFIHLLILYLRVMRVCYTGFELIDNESHYCLVCMRSIIQSIDCMMFNQR